MQELHFYYLNSSHQYTVYSASLLRIMIVILVAIFGFFYMIYTYLKYKDLPPGPYGLPFVGYEPFLGPHPHVQMKKLSLKYGSVFSMNIVNTPMVVVNDWETMNEVLVKKGSVFSGRVPMFLWNVLSQKKDISTTEGALLKEKKRFVMRIMRECGLGTNSSEVVIMNEVNKLMEKLERENGKAVQIPLLLFVPLLNAIWGITAGAQFDLSSKEGSSFKQMHDDIDELTISTGILNFMPYLRHVAPEMTGYLKLCTVRDKIISYLRQVVEQHWNSSHENDNKDIISQYIAEIKKRQTESTNDESPPYDRESLVYVALDLFDGGSGTVTSYLGWAFLYMALWPHVQHKVQQELDSVICNNLHLPYSSRERLPFTMATMNEIHRFSTVAALAIPHAATQDTTIKGYRIKKGTMVVTNLWGLHHDEKAWGDPENFRPERFLDDEGKPKKHESFLPFGAGPRSCIGKSVAELQLFLFFTSIIHRFTFETVPGQPIPSVEPLLGNTLQPQNYSLVVKLRN